jgi:hypothetical protein
MILLEPTETSKRKFCEPTTMAAQIMHRISTDDKTRRDRPCLSDRVLRPNATKSLFCCIPQEVYQPFSAGYAGSGKKISG